MADESEVKRTRRAKRRAEQGESREPSAAPEGSSASPLEAPEAAAAPSKAKRKKERIEAEGPEEIRDRNRRLRAKAAARRRAERERSAPVQGLATSEIVDDALSRSTQALANFIKRHFSVIQWLIVIGIVAGIAWQIYSFRHKRETAKVSDELADAVQKELGRIYTDKPEEPKELKDLVNPLPEFATEEQRAKAASDAYRPIAERGSGVASSLAELGLAGTAYDTGKYDDARKHYEQVKSSKLASQDADVKARATEGIGMALEAKGDKAAALKAFHELENSDLPAFSMLGLYHQARVLFVQGETEKAKGFLKRVRDKLDKQPAEEQQQYLEYATGQLLKILDPAEAAKAASAPAAYTPEQLEALKKQLSEDPSKLSTLLKNLGKGPRPRGPAGNTPAAPANSPAPAHSAP